MRLPLHTSTGTVGIAPLALKPVVALLAELQPLLQGQPVAPLVLAERLKAPFRLLGPKGPIAMALEWKMSPSTKSRTSVYEPSSFSSNEFLTDVPADFLAPETNAGVSRARVDANLRSLALSRFRVVLDYGGRRMFLVPNASFGRPIPVNMAGLVLEQDRGDALVARHVIKGSPAAKKGLRAGDTITAINGRDAREFSYGEVLAVFGEEGRTLRLTVARGGERLEFKVKLRRMI